MRGSIKLAAALVVLGALLTPAAHAGKPVRIPEPPFGTSIDESCPDSIAPQGIEWSDAGGNVATLFFDDGRVLKTGRHPDLATNVATGKSVLLDLQGVLSSRWVTTEAGERLRLDMHGTHGFVFYPGDVGPGELTEPRIYVFTGTARITFDEDFFVARVEHSGPLRDVCAEL